MSRWQGGFVLSCFEEIKEREVASRRRRQLQLDRMVTHAPDHRTSTGATASPQ